MGLLNSAEFRRRVSDEAQRELNQLLRDAEKGFEGADPDEAKRIKEALRSVVEAKTRGGRRRGGKALRELISQGALKMPSLGIRGTPVAPSVARAISKTLRGRELATAIQRTLDENPRFSEVIRRLGNPNVDALAAMLRGAIMWRPTAGAALAGQVATLTGQLFERVRKLSARFRETHARAKRMVEAFDNARLADALRPFPEHMHANVRTAFAKVAFTQLHYFDDVRDGLGRQLSDGMHIAINSRGQILIAAIDEVKLESVADDVFQQFDDVIRRIRERGIIINGILVDPKDIILPLGQPGSGRSLTGLTAYLENKPTKREHTNAGYALAVEDVDAPYLREFVETVLSNWRKQFE